MNIKPGPNFLKFGDLPVHVEGEEPTQACGSFRDLGLNQPIPSLLHDNQYLKPTPIQSNVIPAVQAERDVLACSPTGSGKTAAFLIPIVDKLLRDWREPNLSRRATMCYPHVLIITATRELAIQTLKMCRYFTKDTKIVAQPAYGGTSVEGQISLLLAGCGAHILVATPGRLKHFLTKRVINFSKMRFLVLDEADKMLALGFGNDLEFILNHDSKPKEHAQTLMFSATYPEKGLKRIEKDYMVANLFMSIGQLNAPSLDVEENFIEVDSQLAKRDKLIELLWEEEGKYGLQLTLIFVNRIDDCYDLGEFLDDHNYAVNVMTSNEEQDDREEILEAFRDKQFNILIATDVMARGLNVRDLNHVINYDLPGFLPEYVNRIGRTGRLGNLGRATSFFLPNRKEDEMLGPHLVWCLGFLQKDVPDFLLKYARNPQTVKAAGRRRNRRNGKSNANAIKPTH